MQTPKEILDLLEFRYSNRADKQFDTAYPRVKPIPKKCDDCNKIVENRSTRSSKNLNTLCSPHYKTQCSVCKQYQNPVTGEFDMTGQEVARFFRQKKQEDDK